LYLDKFISTFEKTIDFILNPCRKPRLCAYENPAVFSLMQLFRSSATGIVEKHPELELSS